MGKRTSFNFAYFRASLGFGLAVITLVGSVGLSTASAQGQGLSACGDIRLPAQARCEFVPPSLQCDAECVPVTFQAACEAKLSVSCGGQCSADVQAGCDVACQADCAGDCSVNPGEFSCQGQCELSCEGDCDVSCAADSNSASCKGKCEAACTAGCEGECNVVPPSASCDVKCEAGCQGSCEARANLDCNIDCQADGFASCEANLKGGCELACQGDKGALFCEGQYVDPREDIESCVNALRDALGIEVEGYANADASCSGGSCTAEAEAGISCSVARPGAGQGTQGGAGLLVLALGLVGLIRRSGSRG